VCVCLCDPLRPVLSRSPGRVDPDDIQVAKVVALRVQPVAAGAALGPRSLLRWDSVTDLHLWLCHQRKAQTWETKSRSVTVIQKQHQLPLSQIKFHNWEMCDITSLLCISSTSWNIKTTIPHKWITLHLYQWANRLNYRMGMHKSLCLCLADIIESP